MPGPGTDTSRVLRRRRIVATSSIAAVLVLVVGGAAIVASSAPASADQTWIQEFARTSSNVPCIAPSDQTRWEGSFTGQQEWTPSWSQWANNGAGGWVCTRSITWAHGDPNAPVPAFSPTAPDPDVTGTTEPPDPDVTGTTEPPDPDVTETTEPPT